MKLKAALLGACLALSMTFNASASINRDRAEEIALKRVPGAIISSGALDKVDGRLVWSFDLSQPGSKNFTEVLIDADNGKVLSVRVETPAEQVGKTQPL
jgi:uncharacterized membrane protein YkoI